jgi:mRNA-degrading endonuclease RelE of RelBE toxin-antitoxin system
VLDNLAANVRANLRRRLEAIAANPHGRHGGFEPLAGDLAGLHQLRITRWRAVVALDHAGKTVRVTRLGHRREVYG